MLYIMISQSQPNPHGFTKDEYIISTSQFPNHKTNDISQSPIFISVLYMQCSQLITPVVPYLIYFL